MGEVVKFKKRKLSEKFKGKSLCRDGFHKWKIVANQVFDVKRGKLVTRYECERCGKSKVNVL